MAMTAERNGSCSVTISAALGLLEVAEAAAAEDPDEVAPVAELPLVAEVEDEAGSHHKLRQQEKK
jgi:hypothetical protein